MHLRETRLIRRKYGEEGPPRQSAGSPRPLRGLCRVDAFPIRSPSCDGLSCRDGELVLYDGVRTREGGIDGHAGPALPGADASAYRLGIVPRDLSRAAAVRRFS